MPPNNQPTNSMPPLRPDDPLQGSGTPPPSVEGPATPPVIASGQPTAETITEFNPAAFSDLPLDPTAPLPNSPDSPYPVQASLPGNPGGPPPPPPPPQVPFFLDPRSPYARIGQPPPPPKGRKAAKIILVSVFLLVIFGGIGIFLQAQGGGGNDELFQAALANSLATNNLTQKTTVDQDTITLKEDVSDNRDPKLSGTIDLQSQQAKIEGFATLTNNYVKYDTLGKIKANSTTPDNLLVNKWVQIRNNGKLPTQYAPETSLEGLFDPRVSIYGNSVVFGNFTPADQQTLVAELQAQGVYSFDESSVQATAVDGQAAMQYEVTINPTALKAFNKKAGQMAGIDASELDAAITAADFDTLAKSKLSWFIGTDSQRLIKVTATNGSATTTTEYSDYGSTQPNSEPVADYQYTDFQTLLKGQATVSDTGKAEDIERNSDIVTLAGYLEKYYNTYKFYPSLANVNDSSWAATNLPGMPDNILRDPKGSTNQLAASPTVNQYSYQIYKDKTLAPCDGASCQHFKVSATISDGSVFSQASVH